MQLPIVDYGSIIPRTQSRIKRPANLAVVVNYQNCFGRGRQAVILLRNMFKSVKCFYGNSVNENFITFIKSHFRETLRQGAENFAVGDGKLRRPKMIFPLDRRLRLALLIASQIISFIYIESIKE